MKKGNAYYLKDNTVIVMHSNLNTIFIMDKDKFETLGKRSYTARRQANGRIDTVITINGKTTYLSRWICNCPPGLEVDHINGNTLDNRCINLRIVTKAENLANTKKSLGKIQRKGDQWRLTLPSDPEQGRLDKEIYTFDSEEAAQAFHMEWLLEHYGEHTSDISQRLAARNDSMLFSSLHVLEQTGDEIEALPESSLPRLLLRLARYYWRSGTLTEEQSYDFALQVIEDYKAGKFT